MVSSPSFCQRFSHALTVGANTLFRPSANARQLAEKEGVEIKVELPDMDKSDIHLEVQGDQLVVSGEKSEQSEDKKDKGFHVMERSYGSFERSFTVPADAEEEKVSAQFKDGVLMVHLPKGENAKPKHREIKVS